MKEYIDKFKIKQTLDEAFKNYEKMYKAALCVSSEKKNKKGNRQSFAEISALVQLAKAFKVDHLQWTGEQSEGNSCDGIFYKDSVSQKIELSNLINSDEMKAFAEGNIYQQDFKMTMDHRGQNIKISEEEEKLSVEYRVYKKILELLNNKNQEKYKDFWLVIPYAPCFEFDCLSDDDVKKYIFCKLEKRHKDLVSSVRNIFKKVIFFPYEGADDKAVPFEWDSNSHIDGFSLKTSH